MKYKYITITNGVIWGRNAITKEILGKVLNGEYDTLLDLENQKWFNAEENKWEEIKGDNSQQK